MPELPKLSQILSQFTAPEKQFEGMVEQTGLPTPPPGPMSMLSQFAENVEATAPELPAPPTPAGMELPEFKLPELPEFKHPELPTRTETETEIGAPTSEKGIDF